MAVDLSQIDISKIVLRSVSQSVIVDVDNFESILTNLSVEGKHFVVPGIWMCVSELFK